MNIKMKIKYIVLLATLIASGCSIAPGMHMKLDSEFGTNEKYVYIGSIDQKITVENISDNLTDISETSESYKIGNGDQIAITVWGLPEIFPVVNINPDQNLRRVDSNGNIFFPYAGVVEARGKTQNELREDLSQLLANFFTEPQLDVSIARFNSQKVYLLGEVTRPEKLNITDIPLSLSDALGEVNGLNTNTASGSEVFIIRNGASGSIPRILRADLSSPSGFVDAGNFYLADNDIIYVNAKGTTRWNRVISQFFPFSSFLNSVDNLAKSD